MGALNKLNKIDQRAWLDKVAVTELSEALSIQGKGFMKLHKFFTQKREKLTSYADGDDGLKEFILMNASAILLDGTVDFRKVSFTYSNLVLPMLAIHQERSSMIIQTSREGSDEMPVADGYTINITGVKTDEELRTVRMSEVTKLCLVTYNKSMRQFSKIEISTAELENIKADKATIEIPDEEKVIGVYGVTPDGPTVQAWVIIGFNGDGSIDTYFGDDGYTSATSHYHYP
jgi:hypothetical protein